MVAAQPERLPIQGKTGNVVDFRQKIRYMRVRFFCEPL